LSLKTKGLRVEDYFCLDFLIRNIPASKPTPKTIHTLSSIGTPDGGGGGPANILVEPINKVHIARDIFEYRCFIIREYIVEYLYILLTLEALLK